MSSSKIAKTKCITQLLAFTSTWLYGHLNLVSTSPTTHINNVAVDANILLTFDINVNGATANDTEIKTSGAQTGQIAGAFSTAAETITFNPTTDFKPRELINVTVTSDALGTGAEAAQPETFQVTTSSDSGSATFPLAENQISTTGNGAQSVFAADIGCDGKHDFMKISNINFTLTDDFAIMVSANLPASTTI